MAASAVFRILGKISGLGSGSEFGVRSALSDVPTQTGGPSIQTLTTAAAAIDVGSVISGQLVALMIKALTSNVYIDPTGVSTLVSDYCLIPEGQANLYTFEAAVSCIPVVRAKSAVGQMEYMFVAIS